MGSEKAYARQDSYGLGWADQWDYSFNDERTAKGATVEKGGSKQKVAEYNKKMKEAASTGVVKTKTVVTAGAQKVKTGTSTSIRWLKEQYQKKTVK